MGAGVSLLGTKGTEREEDHSPQSIAEVRGRDIPPLSHIHLHSMVQYLGTVTLHDNRLLFRISILFATSFTSLFLQSPFFALVLRFLPLFRSFCLVFLFHLLTHHVFFRVLPHIRSVQFCPCFFRWDTKAVSKVLMNYVSTDCLCPVIYLRTSIFLIFLFIRFDPMLRLILFRLIHWQVYYTFSDAYSTCEVVPYPLSYSI